MRTIRLIPSNEFRLSGVTRKWVRRFTNTFSKINKPIYYFKLPVIWWLISRNFCKKQDFQLIFYIFKFISYFTFSIHLRFSPLFPSALYQLCRANPFSFVLVYGTITALPHFIKLRHVTVDTLHIISGAYHIVIHFHNLMSGVYQGRVDVL